MLRGIDTKPAEAPERCADSATGGVRTQWGGATPEEASEGGGKEPVEAPEGRADSAAGGVGTSTWVAPMEASEGSADDATGGMGMQDFADVAA